MTPRPTTPTRILIEATTPATAMAPPLDRRPLRPELGRQLDNVIPLVPVRFDLPFDEDDVEPDDEDLAAIEAEWPVLAAELAVVEAQCRFLNSPDVFARRALRRAEAARDRIVAHHTNTTRNHGATHP